VLRSGSAKRLRERWTAQQVATIPIMGELIILIAVVLFLPSIFLLLTYLYTLAEWLDGTNYKKKKKKKKKSDKLPRFSRETVKAILLLLCATSFLMCMFATVDAGVKLVEPRYFWVTGLATALMLISVFALHVPYRRLEEYLSTDKSTVRVKNQEYRLQIFLSGAWDNTAWGGNDEDVVMARAQDILKNNSWNITGVRVRLGTWKGKIVKEFTKKPKKEKKPKTEIISKSLEGVKTYPARRIRRVGEPLRHRNANNFYTLDNKPVTAREMVSAARQYGYEGTYLPTAARILRSKGHVIPPTPEPLGFAYDSPGGKHGNSRTIGP